MGQCLGYSLHSTIGLVTLYCCGNVSWALERVRGKGQVGGGKQEQEQRDLGGWEETCPRYIQRLDIKVERGTGGRG